MKVIATRQGFHGKLREIGETFEVEDGRRASWYVGAEPKEAAKAAPKARTRKDEQSDDLV